MLSKKGLRTSPNRDSADSGDHLAALAGQHPNACDAHLQSGAVYSLLDGDPIGRILFTDDLPCHS